jgi:hypothetical protein
MSPFKIVAIPDAVAAAVRNTGISPFSRHPTHAEVARGHGPCRLCLEPFVTGVERRILFTYDPFEGLESFPLPGPVFIHEMTCARYPERGAFPADTRARAITLNGYRRGRRLVGQSYVTDGLVEGALERLFGEAGADYVHVRDTAAGCYDFRVER